MTHIKTWADRLETLPDGDITTNAHVQSAMLEEIDDLRTALAQQDNTVTALRSQVEYLEKIVEDQAKALAQQVEPTDDQLIKGVKAMRLFVTKNSVADFRLGYMAALAAAPAPQPAHQGERAELIRRLLAIANTEANEVADALNEAADMLQSAQPVAQPAQGVGRTNPGDETGGAVERFGWQTFLGKSPEIIPATNGSFVWYSDYLKLWQSAQPVAQQDHIPDAGEMVLSDDEILTIAHRKATRYTHAVAPGQVTYGFTVAHLLDFANSIREVK